MGEELLDDLVPLCGPCHEMVHDLERRQQIGLDLSNLFDEVRAARYAETRLRAVPFEDDITPKIAASIRETLQRIEESAARGGVDVASNIRCIVRRIDDIEEMIVGRAELKNQYGRAVSNRARNKAKREREQARLERRKAA